VESILVNHIEITPGVRGGKPRLAGTRITVADIAIWHLKLDHSPEQIAADYDLTLSSVYAALAYYYDNQNQIDQQIADDAAFAEAFRRQNPSKLREKLDQLRRE
jgi:uncharacterized protein (DUF433 family)